MSEVLKKYISSLNEETYGYLCVRFMNNAQDDLFDILEKVSNADESVKDLFKNCNNNIEFYQLLDALHEEIKQDHRYVKASKYSYV